MAERNREARDLDRTSAYLIAKDWIENHPLGDESLLARLVNESCQSLALNDVAPKYEVYRAKDGGTTHAETWRYVLYRSLRAVVLFDFARLASSQLEPERLAGTVVLAFRWQLAADIEPEAVVPIEECARRLSENARTTTEFIQRLWTVFDTEFNAELPTAKKLPTPKPLPDASIFRGQSPTTFTNSYQDAELLSIFRRLLQIDPSFRLPPLKPAKSKATVDLGGELQPSNSAAATALTPCESTVGRVAALKDAGLLATLRKQLAAATETLPAPLHPQALYAAAISQPCPSPPDMRLLGQTALDGRLPVELFVVPALRRVALPVNRLMLVDQQEYSLADLTATPQALLIGQPGAGKTTLLGRLTHHINQRPLDDGPGPCLMVTVNADAFVTQATTLKLSAFAAQALHENGFVADIAVEQLADRLEEWSAKGYLCWGVDNVDERLDDGLETLMVELRRAPSYVLALGYLNRPFIRRVQTGLRNLDTVYALQPFDEARVQRYCERYVDMIQNNIGHSDDGVVRRMNSERVLHAVKAHPELAQTPLGLVCLCARVENSGKLLNTAGLYIAERLCRAGFTPDTWLNTIAPASLMTRALYRLARAYWATYHTLESNIPMSANQVRQWLAPTDEPETDQAHVRAVRATRLLIPAYDNGALLFSHDVVYRYLLALAYLNDYEHYWGEALLPSQVHHVFQGELPEEIVGLIKKLAYARPVV